VKIEAICDNCHRRFILSQILPEPAGSGGRCPSCGYHFGRHYVQVLPEAVRAGENAVEVLVNAVQMLQGIKPGFRLDVDGLLRRMSEELTLPRQDESA
jgi:hypothetical protein